MSFSYHFAPLGLAPPLLKDQFSGHHWLYNPHLGVYQSASTDGLGNLVKTVGPLVVQYLVPFVKELVVTLRDSKTVPVNTQFTTHYVAEPFYYW